MRKALLLGGSLAVTLTVVAGTTNPGWSQLSSAPWPKFQRDLGNTGRQPAPYVGPANLNLKWTYTAPNWIKTQVAVSHDGFVYMGHSDQALCKVNAQTGTALEEDGGWCSGHGVANTSSPVIGNGTNPAATNYKIYRGDRGNLFWSMETNGTTTEPTPRADSDFETPGWPYKVPWDGDVFSSGTMHPIDGSIYTACGCLSKGLLHAFRKDGTQKWPALRIGTAGIRNSSPALVMEGGTAVIYIASVNGYVNRIEDSGTPLVRWSKRPVIGAAMHNQSPSVEDGKLYIGSNKGVSSYTANADGTLRWHVLMGAGNFDTTPAIGPLRADGSRWIYVSAYKKGTRTVYRILENGSSNPTVEQLATGPSGKTSQYAQSPSVVIDSIGRAYAGLGNKVIRIGVGGEQRGEFLTAAQVISVSLGDGVMYVNDRASNLYAVGN